VWLMVEEFLRAEGYPEEAIVCVLEIARQEGLSPEAIGRVLSGSSDRGGVTLH
jgi:hypothetical protein